MLVCVAAEMFMAHALHTQGVICTNGIGLSYLSAYVNRLQPLHAICYVTVLLSQLATIYNETKSQKCQEIK